MCTFFSLYMLSGSEKWGSLGGGKGVREKQVWSFLGGGRVRTYGKCVLRENT